MTADAVLTALLSLQRQSWEQGVAAQAALDLGRDDLAVLLARAAVARQTADGRLGDVDGEAGAVNGAACGEAVLHAGRRTGEEIFDRAARRQLGWLTDAAPRAADGTLFHLLTGHEVWADTVYMVVPFLASSGRGDLAATQLRGHRDRLYDERSGLYAAAWSQDTGTLVRPQLWGTGNGWVVAAAARTLHLVPDTGDDLAGHARDVLDACLAHRRADGLFHDVLDDPGTFRETNTAQMLAYAALTGVADGWLPPSYAAVGRDLLAAATRQIDADGWVTGACGSPGFDRPGTSAEAQAFHLMALAAAARCEESDEPQDRPY